MKKKKMFSTKKINAWKRLDIIVFIIIIGWNIISLLRIDYQESFKGIENEQNLIVYILFGIFLLLLLFLRSLPILAIYFAMKFAIKRYRISNATFNASNDIEYYRDLFHGINPATMSLLMDLRLENNKDLGAMKLYYELNDIIKYDDNGNMYINYSSEFKLNKSDEILLNYFNGKNRDLFALNEWKETVICENVNNGLIRRKNNKEKKKSGCWVFVLIYILTLFFMGYIILNIGDFDTLDVMFNEAPTDNIGFLNFISSDKEYVRVILMCLGFMVCFFVHIWNIIASVIYFIAHNSVKVKDVIKRTDEGDYLAEKLYGMKNFIRDFSNLDEASKKHMVLWKEFLIYAVVLEENDTILDEISNVYNINLFDYKKYKG